jgi:hypothetical protein
MMTPLEFEDRYHEIQVSHIDGRGLARSHTVNVHRYRQTGPKAEFPEKDVLISRLRTELLRTGGLPMIEVDRSHPDRIARAFYGKGSPEDCATALTYALRYNRTLPERLQHYCDNVAEIGLDCTGFVNSYFRAIGRLKGDDRLIVDYGRGTLRDAVSEIKPLDVVVWPDNGHIALVASAPDSHGRATVVESANSLNGLTHSIYTFTRVAPNLFSAQRPSGPSSVKVAQVA